MKKTIYTIFTLAGVANAQTNIDWSQIGVVQSLVDANGTPYTAIFNHVDLTGNDSGTTIRSIFTDSGTPWMQTGTLTLSHSVDLVLNLQGFSGNGEFINWTLNGGATEGGALQSINSNHTYTPGGSIVWGSGGNGNISTLHLEGVNTIDFEFGTTGIGGGVGLGLLQGIEVGSPVPEPSSTALLGLGAFGLLVRRKR